MADMGVPATSIGDLIGIGASLFGNIYSNNKSLQIARETNATNMAINDAQLKHQLEQWQRETAYNAPSQQVQRLKMAGLNPQSLVDPGKAQPLNLSSPIPMHGSSVSNPFAGTGIDKVGTTMMQMMLGKEQLEKERLNNYMLGVDASDAEDRIIRRKKKELADIEESGARTAESRQRAQQLKTEIGYLLDSYDYRLQGEKTRLENAQRNNDYLDAMINEQKHSTQRLDAQSVAQIKLMGAQGAAAMLTAKAAMVNAENGTMLTTAQIGQITQMIAQRSEMFPEAIKAARLDNKSKELENAFLPIRNELARMSAEEKKVALQSMVLQLAVEYEADYAPINWILRNFIGISSSEAANAIGSVAGIYTVFKGVKGVKGSKGDGKTYMTDDQFRQWTDYLDSHGY